MYGVIHTSLRDMILENYGDSIWEEIINYGPTKCPAVFLSMHSYEDSATFDLIHRASKVLDAPVNDCLTLFGRYWILKAAPKLYDSLLRSTGTNLFEFLENLDQLHDRISTTFIKYQPPSFRLEKLAEHEARLHYRSRRHGLTPFVIGLLDGMQERFDVNIHIDQIEEIESTLGDYSIFSISVNNR